MEYWTRVLDLICKLARKTPWLREECGKILYESVRTMDPDPSRHAYIGGMIEQIRSNGLLKTPEGVAIWLAIRSFVPKFELPDGVWHHKDPLCSKERQTLANVMRESNLQDPEAASGDSDKLKSGSSQTKLNFAWDVVIMSFIEKQQKTKSKSSQHGHDLSELDQFWVDVVDSEFCSPRQHERTNGCQTTSSPPRPHWTVSRGVSNCTQRSYLRLLSGYSVRSSVRIL